MPDVIDHEALADRLRQLLSNAGILDAAERADDGVVSGWRFELNAADSKAARDMLEDTRKAIAECGLEMDVDDSPKCTGVPLVFDQAATVLIGPDGARFE